MDPDSQISLNRPRARGRPKKELKVKETDTKEKGNEIADAKDKKKKIN